MVSWFLLLLLHSSIVLGPEDGGGGKKLNFDKPRILESLKSGKRLPEARFSNARMASSAQASVYDKLA